MTWVKFREALERKFLVANILYVQAHEYLNMGQEHITIKEFSTKLNAFVWYAFGVTNTDKGKIKIFINGLRSNIAKDVLIRDNPPRSYSGALGKTFNLEIMRQRMTKERGEHPRLVTLALR